ncbi:DUF6268 family outer membrane beta-barrel protein [Lutibacter sp. A80]|uniref:DUF6268 family outer membrane beta-barrel protein n=1 Tax=Lutibacter sp. A80 TaxID=2918453 RepID=UPI001F06982D|nr:DUF6268 family outer membrane beta-barrel protein [Lutibacter sp. A80]UMB59882.1 DUF6268 family outer membrane beta-barrel protein [Lutibacter sp. A80]
MIMAYRVLLIFLMLGANLIVAQTNDDLFVTGFNYVPGTSNSVGFQEANVAFDYSVDFKEGVLTNSLAYSNHKINYNSNEVLNESLLGIESFESVAYTLQFKKAISNGWGYLISASPSISSNFESSISFDDVIFNGAVIFSKMFINKKLNFGVVRNSSYGFSTPIPVVSIAGAINQKLTYSVGFPIIEFLYKVNTKNQFSLYAKPKGFYSNITNEIVVNIDDEVEKAQFNSIVSGLKYSHSIDDNWKVELDAAYQLKSDYELLDKNLNSVYEFKTKNNFSAGVSLKFNLLNDKS